MIFETYNIQTPPANYIDSIFYYKDYIPEHNIERVVPTGNIFILFEFDNIPRHTFDRDLNSNGTFTKAWVSGMHQKYLSISAHKNSEMLVIQLNPIGGFPLFKKAISNLNDKVEPAETYFGEIILRIRQDIIEEPKIDSKFKIIEEWLLKMYDESLSASEELIEILGLLQSKPFVKHKELLENYPKTQKQLILQFKKYCGLTPKTLHRIFRFNKLLNHINQKKEIVWSDIVYETGYMDQSHFIKDFYNFCGFNPTKYITNGYNNSIPNFFPIDKKG